VDVERACIVRAVVTVADALARDDHLESVLDAIDRRRADTAAGRAPLT